MNLLPLEVVPPGWVVPEPHSDFLLLMLTVGAPLIFGAIVTLLVFAPKIVSAHKAEAAPSTELANRD